MLKITSITKQKRSPDRYNIFIDHSYAGALNAEAMVVHHIKEDMEIDPDAFRLMVTEDNQKYAFQIAVKQIASRRRTVQEVKNYLANKELSQDVIDHAVAKLLDYGYLNDLDYANEFVSYHINSGRYGRVVLIHKMEQKGFGSDTIAAAIAAFSPDIEYRNAKAWYDKLIKKHADTEAPKRREKIYRSLAGKGFSYDIISSLLAGEDS